MKFFLCLLLTLNFSCTSYVKSIHKQIDNESNSNRGKRYANQRGYRNKRQIRNPITLNGVPTANNNRNYAPGTKRQYNSRGVRRYKANDLRDNDSDGSLWSGKNSESFLFVTNNQKKKGDIVIIEVLEKLKDKIQSELKRNFPDSKKKKTAKKGAKADDKKTDTPPVAQEIKSNNPDKVHDKISASVVEIVNQDYMLVRGRKEVMFKKRKRYFEIQAVVSQKDILSNDTVKSSKMLEPRINVLRY